MSSPTTTPHDPAKPTVIGPDEPQPTLDEALRRIANLEAALRSSRTIGTAIGILVERHRISSDEAFERIATYSQSAHRKLRDIAAELVYTGEEPARAA